MKIFLCHGILANIGSLNKTLNHKLYKTTLKSLKNLLTFHKICGIIISRKGEKPKYRRVWRIPRRFLLPNKPKGVIPMGC